MRGYAYSTAYAAKVWGRTGDTECLRLGPEVRAEAARRAVAGSGAFGQPRGMPGICKACLLLPVKPMRSTVFELSFGYTAFIGAVAKSVAIKIISAFKRS